MTKYREILRLSSLGFSNRNIALSVPCSRNTVAKVLKRAQELDISWPLEDNQTDGVLESLFYPKQSDRSQKRMPDYDYIHKELLRNGVSKKLLWTEYMEDCRANGDEPLMYSQFCYHIQQDEQKRRATMHIKRKPGEQVEVDWAGDPAIIIDPEEERERIYLDMRGKIATNNKTQNKLFPPEMIQNASKDITQYKRYKEVLGDSVERCCRENCIY